MARTHIIRNADEKEVGQFDLDTRKLTKKDRGKQGDSLVSTIRKLRRSGIEVIGRLDGKSGEVSGEMLIDQKRTIPFSDAPMSTLASALQDRGFYVDFKTEEEKEFMKKLTGGR